MRVVIAGGSGLLGSALGRSLRAEGHQVTVLTRTVRGADQIAWNPPELGPWSAHVDGADAVVNLAGDSIDGGRWTAARKARILESRIAATRAMTAAIGHVRTAPAVLVSGSAVGFYGPHGDEPVTEQTPPGSDFLASVCVAWEAAANEAASRTRVVVLRTGLVLSASGGALPPMARPFRLFAGGPVGSGRQWWSWVHLEDWVTIARWAMQDAACNGAVNVTAPSPVRNRDFATALGHALRRPSLLPAPAVALRLLLGEMADALILNGQRVLPERALSAGVAFRFPDLRNALADLFQRV